MSMWKFKPILRMVKPRLCRHCRKLALSPRKQEAATPEEIEGLQLGRLVTAMLCLCLLSRSHLHHEMESLIMSLMVPTMVQEMMQIWMLCLMESVIMSLMERMQIGRI